MGEYRVKSGQSMPGLKPKSLPNLPRLGSLDKKLGSLDLNHNDGFSLDSAPTEMVSADDILEAVGGIDGWDSVPDELGLNDVEDTKSLLNSLNLDGDDVLTSVFVPKTAEKEENLPSLKGSPSSVTGKKSSSKNSKVSLPDLPDLPSLKRGDEKSGIAIAPSSSGIPRAPERKSSETPKVTIAPLPATSVEASESSETIAIKVKQVKAEESIGTDEGTQKNAEPAADSDAMFSGQDTDASEAGGETIAADLKEITEPAAAESVSEPEAVSKPDDGTVSEPEAGSVLESETDAGHAPPPVPVSTEKTPSVTREAETEPEEMTAEEQYEAILAGMTPEERAEYEAHSQDQEQQRAIAKQQELYELYGSTSKKQSIPPGVFVIGLIVIGAFGGFIYWIINGEHSSPEAVSNEKQEVQAVEPERVYERAPAMDTYSVKLNMQNVSHLYINGAEQPVGAGSFQFVSGHRNSIMAFGEGRVPYFKTFDASREVTEPIEINLEPDTLWLKGDIKFRLANTESLSGSDVKVTLDGQNVGGLNTPITDVVLGRPHVLLVKKKGLASHMHIIWPDSRETTVQIPELELEETAKGGTRCNVKLPPASGKPVGVKIITGDQEYDSNVDITILRGGMIEYYITREQRHSLQVAVVPPEEVGTLSLDTSLLRNSIGRAIVSFNRPAGSMLRVCIRRSGELICPDMSGETEVPSGPDWEFLGAEGVDGNLHAIRGSQNQELVKDRKYGFDVKTERGIFSMKQASYARLKN